MYVVFLFSFWDEASLHFFGRTFWLKLRKIDSYEIPVGTVFTKSTQGAQHRQTANHIGRYVGIAFLCLTGRNVFERDIETVGFLDEELTLENVNYARKNGLFTSLARLQFPAKVSHSKQCPIEATVCGYG
jgi:hypothetical protein